MSAASVCCGQAMDTKKKAQLIVISERTRTSPPRVSVFPVRDLYNFRDDWHQSREGGTRLHKGIDIRAPQGACLVAVTEGLIAFKDWDGACGWTIVLEDKNGWNYYYGHLERWADVVVGERVSAGSCIGYVGSTGNAGFPHLHFSIFHKEDGYERGVNPFPYLRGAGVESRRSNPTFQAS